MLSYRYWQEKFNGDASVVETALEISKTPGDPDEPSEFRYQPEQDSAQFRIVGIMAPTLPPVDWVEPGIWVPLERAWPMFLGTAASLKSYTGAGLTGTTTGGYGAARHCSRNRRCGDRVRLASGPSRVGLRLGAVRGNVDTDRH